MNAESARQLRLLDLQAIDTRLDQIAHARSHLPQLAELDDLLGKARLIDDQLVRSRTELDDVQREVAKAESDVQLVRDRAARDQARLDAGTGSAKDLQAIQHELTSLARRQSELEDIELEVMERAEAAENDVAELERGRGELTTRIEALEAREEARGGTPYLVDAGHWASEQVWLARAERALRAGLGERATRVETHISTVRTDPWTFVVGADPGGMP